MEDSACHFEEIPRKILEYVGLVGATDMKSSRFPLHFRTDPSVNRKQVITSKIHLSAQPDLIRLLGYRILLDST